MSLAFINGFFSALTIGISILTVKAVAVGSNHIGFEGVIAISFLSAALPEEAAKLAILLTIVYRYEDVHRPIDYVLAAGWVGLGFAGLENIFYVFGELTNENMRWLAVSTARAATAVPSHTITGVLMGLLLARTLDDTANRALWIAGAFVLPFLLHGLYDVCVLSLRREFGGLLTEVQRWHFALGLGAVMSAEAWLTVFLVRRRRLRWDKAAPTSSLNAWSRWKRRFFTLIIVLTVLMSLGLIGLGIIGIWRKDAISTFAGAGIAWLGIIYVMRLIRESFKAEPPDSPLSPQVAVSKDLVSGL
ncbi:PrsW family glutamic-type intramembrane protease [Microvirga sp. 0TCS3.31]